QTRGPARDEDDLVAEIHGGVRWRSGGVVRAQDVEDAVADLVDRTHARDLGVAGRFGRTGGRPAGVVIHQRAGLVAVDRQAVADGFLAVVVALDRGFAGLGGQAFALGRVELDVAGPAAGHVPPPAAHAFDDVFLRDGDL